MLVVPQNPYNLLIDVEDVKMEYCITADRSDVSGTVVKFVTTDPKLARFEPWTFPRDKGAYVLAQYDLNTGEKMYKKLLKTIEKGKVMIFE